MGYLGLIPRPLSQFTIDPYTNLASEKKIWNILVLVRFAGMCDPKIE